VGLSTDNLNAVHPISHFFSGITAGLRPNVVTDHDARP